MGVPFEGILAASALGGHRWGIWYRSLGVRVGADG